MCDGESVMVTPNSLLTESLWSGHSGDRVRVLNFMAAYGRERSMTSDTNYNGPAAALGLVACDWKSVPSCAVLPSGSVTKMNRRGHRQLQSEIIKAVVAVQWNWITGVSAGDSVHVNKWIEKTDNTDTRCGDRPPTTRVQRVPQSFPGCLVGHHGPGSGSHMLHVIHSM